MIKTIKLKDLIKKYGTDVDKLDILVIEANTENVKQLVQLSYLKPFMRIIIDDYTSMNDVDSFRQILSSSTIFVSGSKFQRAAADIPPSYYTLKHVPVNQLSVVGNPEDTLQGILRDNIATLELMGNSCEFNTYSFVNILENTKKRKLQEGTLSFNDVPMIDTEYIPHIGKAVEGGIISGYSDGTFRPQEPITRAEVATMIYRVYR